jgi:D-3-phosphoglycerate dehydrogenase / 2-oxoglutarate reductase
MPTAVLTDYSFSDVDVERAMLEPHGCTFTPRQCKTPAELIELCADADFVITQFAKLDAAVIGAMRKARVIVRYGIGVDNVDLEAARTKGIPVCNVPDYCIDEVADHTLGMTLDLTRRISQSAACIHAGEWRLPVTLPELRALRDMTVGVVGFGRIGREVVRRLTAFKPAILVHDPVVDPTVITAAGCVPADIDEILAKSDLITLHCPSTAKTKRMLNSGTFARCKRGVLLVNVGRGDLVDTAALVDALKSGQVGAAGLDVCDPEPLAADHPLRAMPQVQITPHVASGSVRAVRSLRESVAKTVLTALRREPLANVVNGVAQPAAAGSKG